MRTDGGFEHYVRVCDTGEAFVDEVTYDAPFGEGWIRGTSSAARPSSATACSILVTDITEQRRVEAELRGFADLVAHDLREPVTGIAHLVTLLERRADAPPDPALLNLLRASTERARELIDGVLAYARAGELARAGRARRRSWTRSPRTCGRAWRRRARSSRSSRSPRSAATRVSCAASCRTSSRTP